MGKSQNIVILILLLLRWSKRDQDQTLIINLTLISHQCKLNWGRQQST